MLCRIRVSLVELVPKLARSLGKQIKSSSTQTRQTAFSLLRHLVQALDARIDASVFTSFLVSPVLVALGDSTLTHSSTNSSVKIEALMFLAAYFQRPGAIAQEVLDEILSRVIDSCKDKYYKITVQALVVLDSLVRVVNTRENVSSIYGCIITLLETGDADVEVKERALAALGSLMEYRRDMLDPKEVEGRVMPMLVDRLGSEVTRLVTLRVLKRIKGGMEGILKEVVAACVLCMRQSGRQILIAALECLVVFVGEYPRIDVYGGVLTQGAVLLGNNSDPAVFCLLLEVCGKIIRVVGGGCVSGFRELYVEPLMTIALASPHMFSGAGVLREFGRLWRAVVVSGADVGDGAELVRGLVKEIKGFAIDGKSGVEKQAFPVVANAVVSVCCFEERGELFTVPEWVKVVQREIAGEVYREVCEEGKKKKRIIGESEKYLGLLILGEIGQRMYVVKLIILGIF
jgi:hypothetical protein